MAGRAVGEQHQLVPPLAERQEQRQQDRQDVEPVADRHVDHHGAGRGAQHEPDRDRQHVDDDDVLQRAGVERQQRQVRRQRARRTAAAARTRAASADAAEHRRGVERHPHRQRADAIGRCVLTGCRRSASRSATSLIR